jgi:hypothetical protein
MKLLSLTAWKRIDELEDLVERLRSEITLVQNKF